MKQTTALTEVTILFAGDSGDGMQLTGNEFSQTTALFGNDIATFPNFPAEAWPPQLLEMFERHGVKIRN